MFRLGLVSMLISLDIHHFLFVSWGHSLLSTNCQKKKKKKTSKHWPVINTLLSNRWASSPSVQSFCLQPTRKTDLSCSVRLASLTRTCIQSSNVDVRNPGRLADRSLHFKQPCHHRRDSVSVKIDTYTNGQFSKDIHEVKSPR